MTIKGFTNDDFSIFTIDGLEERMEAIQQNIQPKFRIIGQVLCDELSILTGKEMYLHIAKHARRTVNPPKDTWFAISDNKRGYKQHPHFQLGLFDDHLFLWLAFIYELPNKQAIATTLLDNLESVYKIIPGEYVISLDHTKKESLHLKEIGKAGLEDALNRFRQVKKAEFLVGLHIDPTNPLVHDGEKLVKVASGTFKTLLPLFKLAYK